MILGMLNDKEIKHLKTNVLFFNIWKSISYLLVFNELALF